VLEFDIICVQEHWLTPANLFKLHNLSDNYKYFGSSAMEEAVSIGVIKGRPKGGVGILIKYNLINDISKHVENEFFELIVLNNLIIVS